MKKKPATQPPFKTDEKSTGQSTALPVGALVPQSHGGALRNGGTNRGGSGRPASLIRKKLQGSFAKRIKTLEEIADDPTANKPDRLKAIDLMGKYGLGTTKELTVDTVRERLQKTIDIIREELPEPDANRLLDALESVWA
jgi:hypothetical protein